MARGPKRRRFRLDHLYGDWHRYACAEMYERNGHRLDLADRDWTEMCNFCRDPLGFAEEVTDRGQILNEKATTVTRKIAQLTDRPAIFIAPRIERPPEVQREMDRLAQQLDRLEALYPIVSFTVRRIWPEPTGNETMDPQALADEIFLLHRSHHQQCPYAQRSAPVYRAAAIAAARARSHLWFPKQPRLWDEPLDDEAA